VRLYLASTSPARLTTLRAVGVEPVVLASHVDEDAAVAAAGPLTTVEMVEFLARLKAEAVLGALGALPDAALPGASGFDGFILGCDSAFELDGITYGKPHLPEVARERWLLQRGRAGHLHSGHWLIDVRGGVLGEARGGVSTSMVRFAANITDDEIDAYVATGEPLQVAGAFTIDSLGAPFIAEVQGDPHAIVGVSVAMVRELLTEFDVSWPTLWNRAV
jgi:septum formation protein